jgi:hypothetical protein
MLFAAKHSYNLSSGAANDYFSPIHIDTTSIESYDVMGVIPVACTMTNMAVKASTGLEAGVTMTFTFRKGTSLGTMADTTLHCSVTSASTFCTDAKSISMNAGDSSTSGSITTRARRAGRRLPHRPDLQLGVAPLA